jgi:hypothetical protein
LLLYLILVETGIIANELSSYFRETLLQRDNHFGSSEAVSVFPYNLQIYETAIHSGAIFFGA